MTIPRELGLTATGEGPRLTQQPVSEVSSLYENGHQIEDITISNESFSNEELQGTTYRLKAEINLEDADTFGFKLRKGDDEETLVGYDTAEQHLFVDRRKSGVVSFHDAFAADKQMAPLDLQDNTLILEILVDRSSVEIFANGGKRSITNRIFPSEASDQIEIFSEGGSINIVQLDFRNVRSTWVASN